MFRFEAGRVYVLSYPELECLAPSANYKGKYDTYIACPTCLLYVRRDSHLVPVAIQLQPGEKQLVWTPDDSQSDWLFAKMWVREADAQIHQVMARHLQASHKLGSGTNSVLLCVTKFSFPEGSERVVHLVCLSVSARN